MDAVCSMHVRLDIHGIFKPKTLMQTFKSYNDSMN